MWPQCYSIELNRGSCKWKKKIFQIDLIFFEEGIYFKNKGERRKRTIEMSSATFFANRKVLRKKRRMRTRQFYCFTICQSARTTWLPLFFLANIILLIMIHWEVLYLQITSAKVFLGGILVLHK